MGLEGLKISRVVVQDQDIFIEEEKVMRPVRSNPLLTYPRS
jgi:hypothetical protein